MLNRAGIFIFALVFIATTVGVRAQQAETSKADPPVSVTVIDTPAMLKLLSTGGKPVVVNFWATWCEPCREEFPDLVKLHLAYQGKAEVITISLDDPAEKDTTVTGFLSKMNAKMPAYLLKTTDETAAIEAVTDDWSGALPFTLIYDAQGKRVYQKMGKFKYPVLTSELDKLFAAAKPAETND